MLVIAGVLVGVPTAIADHEASKYFVFSPGTAPVITTSSKCKFVHGNEELPDATPCVLLLLPKGKAHLIDGKLMMVDVDLAPAGPLDWAKYELGLLGSDRQFVPVDDYLGATPSSEMGCQDAQEMTSADQDAALAALAALHYHVREAELGAQVTTVYAGTPAWRAGIDCNDVITAVDGKPVVSAQGLTDLVHALPAGTVVVLTDRPAGGGATKRLRVKLGRPPASVVAEGFTGKGYLGIALQTQVSPRLPFPVSVDAGDIGGPSAGLAFTLAILDALSNGKLTGGHRVAATGTMDPEGDVGDVGGVKEKTVAVEKAGAQIFFVPKVEYAAAMSEAKGGLQVVPVTTLDQVLRILHQRFGGDIAGLSVGART
jgi:PDZ domain-containing protein